MKIKVAFLGTPDFISPVRECIKKNFELSDLDQEIDLIVVASYGKILTPQHLEIPKFGAINIHPSKLPEFRGPSPIQTQILQGLKESAVTFIKMDKEVDHGPILKIIPFKIQNNDTFESTAARAFKLAADNLPKIIDDFVKGKIKPIEQNHSDATFTKILRREDGFFDIENPPTPETLERKIRAYYKWPGVYTKFEVQNEKLKVLKFLPGDTIQVEGKKPMSYKDFINGYSKGKEILSKLKIVN